MNKIFVLLLVSQLTGCTGMLNAMDRYAMNNSPCLRATINNQDIPDFCGAGSGTRYYTRDYRTNAIVATTQANIYGNQWEVDSLGRITK